MSPPTHPSPVSIKKGLEGQDDNHDLLESYFQELKAVTVEPSAPHIDLLTFATCTHYFGVISLKPGTQQDEGDEDAEGEPEEDSVDAGYVASPPPPSVTSSATSFSSACSASRFGTDDSQPGRSTFEDEKVLKWREAFLARLHESDGDEDLENEPLFLNGKMPERDIREERPNLNVPYPSMGNDFDAYINWPDDVPSDDDHSAPNGNPYMLDHNYPPNEQEFTSALGRDILEPEQFSSPVREIPEIPADPKLKKFVYDEAIKFRDAWREQRVQAYQKPPAYRPIYTPPPISQSTPIGIIYLASSQTVDDSMHRGQLNIGIYVAPEYTRQRGLVDAVKEVVREAFQDISCHRIQAIVVDHNTQLHTMELYTSTGFSREGRASRAFFSPVTHEWKDVTYFAILDTDWINENGRGSSSVRPRRPKSVWDDLLICQQREREELLSMEEKTLKRSSSIETIRDKAPSSIANTSRSETSSVTSSSTSAATTHSQGRDQSPKRRRVGKSNKKKSKAPSSSTSSMGTIDTMSTISSASEWEIPTRQSFINPSSNGASTSSIGHWVMLDANKI